MSIRTASFILCCFVLMPSLYGALFKIMLDPAGDAQQTGRIIDNTFERGITMQMAQKLKENLEKKVPNTTILLSRMPGETRSALEKASYANRLATNLYISIHAYQTTSDHSIIALYHYTNNDAAFSPVTSNANSFAFLPYDQVYRTYYETTSNWIKELTQELSLFKEITVQGPYALPCRPLVGVNAPAIMCEIGIKQQDDWQALIEPCTQALSTLCTKGIR